MTPRADPFSLKNKMIIGGFVGAYVLVVVILSLLGYFGYIGKTIIVPSLLLIALLTKRFVPFVNEWAVFLSLTVLFDCLRGEAYYLTITLKREIYMGYAIDLERVIFGEPIPTIALQRILYTPPEVGIFENILTVFHGSHFLLFLLFAFFVWHSRRNEFSRFKIGLLFVMYVGVVIYYLVPTVPPWLANWYHVLPTVHRIVDSVYNITVPVLRSSFDTNPVAAMPSLHSAFPIFCTFVGFYHYRWRGVFLAVYTAVVLFAIVYMGEHYIVDVIAGFLLALIAFLLSYYPHLFVPKDLLGRIAEKIFKDTTDENDALGFSSLWRGQLGKKVMLSIFIVAASELIGQQVSSLDTRMWPTRRFAMRELVGKSDMAHYYLGARAFVENDFPTAQKELSMAIPEMGTDGRVKLAIIYLGMSAYANGDFDTSIWALKMVPPDYEDPTARLTLALSYLGKNDISRAWRVVKDLRSAHGRYPAVVSWYAEIGYYAGELPRQTLVDTIRWLRTNAVSPKSEELSARLREALETADKPSQVPLPAFVEPYPDIEQAKMIP